MKTPAPHSGQIQAAHTKALYAGSFDPWSEGHQFVLDNGLKVFSNVHVVLAINPAKTGSVSVRDRMILIAAACDPFTNWIEKEPPFEIDGRLKIDTTQGLVVEYAREHAITHLLRGLRSTTDFEAEFNLYFSNRAILKNVQTWALMCPPELLHCSSSYVKAVVGKQGVPFVGTSFLAQSFLTAKNPFVGQIFDLIRALETQKYLQNDLLLKPDPQGYLGALQLLYARLMTVHPAFSRRFDLPHLEFWNQIHKYGHPDRATVRGEIDDLKSWLWSQLIVEIVQQEKSAGLRVSAEPSEHWRLLQSIVESCETLGFSASTLFDRKKIEDLFI
jgi:pantetheine-phosphate adenylyltransferase